MPKKSNGLGGLGGFFTTRRRSKKSKQDSAFGKLGKSTKDRRRKKNSDFGGLADGLADRLGGKKSRGNASTSRMVKQAASAWLNRMSPTERADERERTLDELENNPKRFAEEVRSNRLAAVLPWIRRIAGYLSSAANRKPKE